MTSVEQRQSTIPPGTALLGDLVDVTVDEVLLSGRRPVVAPDAPVEGYGAATWHAFAAVLVDRVAELEAENEALRAGAMHPTARDLLEQFLSKLDRALPSRQAEPAPLPDPAPAAVAEMSDPASADPSEPVEPVDVIAEPVDGMDDDMVASIAGAAEGVDFWDEASGSHGLIGRVRRSLRGRKGARGNPTATSDSTDSTDIPAEPSAVVDEPEHTAQAA